MITYIKQNHPYKFADFVDPITSATNDNLGSTYEDYLKNFWVPLNAEQTAYHKEHPNASVYEVWHLGVYPQPPVEEHERTLDEAKMELANKIRNYDNSDEVNAFIVNGNKYWFAAQERANYNSSIKSARLLGEETIQVYLGENLVDIPCDNAEIMLAQIQRYADKCFIVTKQHNLAVERVETIEECDGYNFTEGYPEMLSYSI